MSVYYLQHRVDLGRQMPLGGRPQDEVPRGRDGGDLFAFHFDRAHQSAERSRHARRGIKQIEIGLVRGGQYDPFRHYLEHPPRQPVSQAVPPVEGSPHVVQGFQQSDVAGDGVRRNSPIEDMLQPAAGVSPTTGEQAVEAAPVPPGEQEPVAEPAGTQQIAPAPTTEVREGRHGQIGMTNPAMQAYESFDPSQYGSYEAALGAVVEMHEADKAAYGNQMASRMRASRGGKAFQHFHAVDPENTPRDYFGLIPRPWVTAYNGGVANAVLQDLVDGHVQFSDVPEHLQGYFYRGLRNKLRSTGAYTGFVMPTDVSAILHSLRVQQERQAERAAG